MFSTPLVNSNIDLKSYFIEQGLEEIVDASDAPGLSVNEMITETPYLPELEDLYRLHRFIIEQKRTTILEFGSGWSTLIFAHALRANKKAYSSEVATLRRNNPFEVHAVDNEKRFMKMAENRIPANLKGDTFFHFSEVQMVEFQGRFSTLYETLPLINPDFIYLDGPDQFNVINEISGFTTAHKDMMPMSCDILRLEHFLTPGTIIVVDGRAANARFLNANFQRGWSYVYEAPYDQHIFQLDEEPLGMHNKRQLDFYAS